MANDSNKGCVRYLGAAFGGLLGAAGVAWYMRRKWAFDPDEAAPARVEPATQGIVLKPAQLASVFSVSLHAEPDPLVRNQPVTVRAKAAPGALCTLTARYSTGYTPNSLDTEQQKADAEGVCEWTWEIGTTGSYVDVTVEAQNTAGETANDEVRFQIID